MSLFESFSFFRPDDEDLAPRVRSEIQGYRLLSLLGAGIYLSFGLLHTMSTPGATNPLWARLAVSGLLVALFIASYTWPFVRRTYPEWIHGMFYVIITWIAVLAGLNHFDGNFLVGLLATFAIFTALIGFHAGRIGPVLRFSVFVVVVTGGGIVLGPPSRLSPVLLFSSIGSVAAVASIVILWAASVRDTIRRQEQRLRTIAKNVSDGIYRSAPDAGLVYANPAFADMFGYDCLEELLALPPSRLYADPSRRAELRERAKEDGKLAPTEVEFRRKDGSTFTGLLCEAVVRDEEGTIQYSDGTLTDISERKERERELARRKALLEAQAEATIDGLLVVDSNRNLIFYNDRFLEIWDIPKCVAEQDPNGQLLDKIFLDYVTDFLQNPVEFREQVEHLYDHPTKESRDLISLTDGRWLDRYSTPIVDEDGTYFGRLWVFRDVADQKRRERELEHKATHDELTGVPNRAALHDELSGLIEPSNDTLNALLYLDLDQFKRVNDTLGHVVGDKLLVHVAERIQRTVRDTDLVARVGGDEFAVCLSAMTAEQSVYEVAERIHEELSNAVEVEGQEVYAPASIGVVVGLSRFDSVDAALRAADAAMYEAKNRRQPAGHTHQPFVVFKDSQPRGIDGDIRVNGD